MDNILEKQAPHFSEYIASEAGNTTKVHITFDTSVEA